MGLAEFFITVVLISASGALAPGPLFFATIMVGMKGGGKAGLEVSIGHTAAEFPLVVLLAYGLGHFLGLSHVQVALGVIGGGTIIALGLLQVYESYRAFKRGAKVNNEAIKRKTSKYLNPFFIGFALSMFNPFFLLWWATIGLALIAEALALAAFTGILLMYVFHVWMDYAWLTFTAAAVHKSEKLVSSRTYNMVLAFLCALLILLGVNFITKSTLSFAIIPL